MRDVEKNNSVPGRPGRNRSYTQSCSGTDSQAAMNSWQSLSSDIGQHKKQNSSKLDRSFLAFKKPIKEENEKSRLIAQSTCSTGISGIYSSIDTLGQSLLLTKATATESESGPGFNWFCIAFGLANASVGVGILNYPATYDKIGGVAIATYVQLVIVAIIMLTMAILIYCADISKGRSYHEVLSSICGKRIEIVVAFDIFLATYGICIAYLVTIGDQYDRMFASYFGSNFCQFWYLDRKFTITVTAALFAPLCYLKQLSFLRHTGPLGIISMLYVVLLTVYQYFVPQNIDKGNVKTSPDSFINVLSMIPVLSFAYQTNEVIIPMYYSMKDRSMKNFYKAAFLAWGTLLFLYCAVGYFGYMTFGSNVLPDIIQMFDAKDPFVMIAICALILKMAVTYPQMSFVGRGAFVGIYGIMSNKTAQQLEKKETRRRYFISSLWFISSLFIGLFAPDIGIVIEILGILSVANVFIFPSICLLCLARRNDLRLSYFVKFSFILGAIILTSFGIVIMFFVVYQVYIDIIAISQQANVALCVA